MTMTIMTEYRLNVTIIPQYHSCPYYYFRISSKYLADNIISDIAPIKPTKYIMGVKLEKRFTYRYFWGRFLRVFQ